MARRKKKDADAAQDPGIGHNKPELTEDEQRVLLYEHKASWSKANQAVEAAKAERKRVEERAKADLGKSAVADIKDLILLDSPKGEAAMRADIERQLRLARWANSRVGTQFKFDEFDAMPAAEFARDLGKTAGLKGEPCKPPYDPSVPQHQAWIDGWHEGQAVLASNFRTKLDGGGQQADLAQRGDIVSDRSTMVDPPFAVPPEEMPAVPAQPQ